MGLAFLFTQKSPMYTELNRAAIATLVNDFYADIRQESLLGPIFNGAVKDNWEPHLARMVDFWCSVMLASGEFKGNVFGTHMQIQGVDPEHFRRWFGLFETHVRRLFLPEVADAFMGVAKRIGASLQYGYFGRVDVA